MTMYGKTWWGQKWLETFNDISDDNRLPRGQTYANTGRAHTIILEGNTVTAIVNGSRPYPYEVTINFKEFDKETQEKLKNIIADSPLILSNLLHKKLPPDIVQLLDHEGIKLFPKSWKEIDASCSCPDWAMPCKHIASVIYLLCSQIDKNPFVLFNVHDCDLLSLIADYGEVELNAHNQITTIESLFKKQVVTPQKEFDCARLASIDFSKIPYLSNCIITILSDNPPFYDANFKNVLKDVYNHWQKKPLGCKQYAWGTVYNTKNERKKETTEQSEEQKFLDSVVTR